MAGSNRSFAAAAVAAVLSFSPAPGQDVEGSRTAVATAADALRPARVLEPPGGPRLVQLPSAASPRASLRISVPVAERPAEAGAARVLQLLGLQRARSAAAPVGARVEGSRTPWGIAYTVSGAAADLDYLAYVLREAVGAPSTDPVAFERARTRALEEARRLQETAAGAMTSRLRAALDPERPPVEGTPASVAALEPAAVRNMWARTHRRERMTVVAAGDAPAEVLLASFQDAGSRDADTPPPTAPGPDGERAETEVLRRWYGEAREAGDLRDPHGLVAARLVGDRLEAATSGRLETRLEVWEIGSQRVLAVMAAAYPGQEGLRELVTGALPAARREAFDAVVRQAAAEVRAGLLANARTPAGMARLVGRYLDATGDPAGAATLMEALGRVTAESVDAFLAELESRTPARSELRP